MWKNLPILLYIQAALPAQASTQGKNGCSGCEWPGALNSSFLNCLTGMQTSSPPGKPVMHTFMSTSALLSRPLILSLNQQCLRFSRWCVLLNKFLCPTVWLTNLLVKQFYYSATSVLPPTFSLSPLNCHCSIDACSGSACHACHCYSPLKQLQPCLPLASSLLWSRFLWLVLINA